MGSARQGKDFYYVMETIILTHLNIKVVNHLLNTVHAPTFVFQMFMSS